MNIIFLLNSTYPCYTGGRENWLYHVSQMLCHRYNITIVCEMPTKDSAIENGMLTEIDSRIKIIHVANLRNSVFTRWLLHSYGNMLNQEVTVRAMWNKLKNILYKCADQKTVVISMDTVFMGRLGAKAKKRFPNIFFVNSVRCPHAEAWSDRLPILSKYFFACERRSLAGADQIWSNGKDTQEAVKKKGFSSVIIKNGVDIRRAGHCQSIPAEWVQYDADIHLITIGTLLDVKGYRELIQAVAILQDKYGIRLGVTAFGKGNPLPYRNLAKDLGVDDLIYFAGYQAKTIEYAESFDLVACLSGGSGLSMACIESMLSGTPIIAWDSTVYQQMLTHMQSGYLVKAWDANALAEGIAWMYTNPKQCKKMGQLAKKAAEKYDWKEIVRQIEEELM